MPSVRAIVDSPELLPPVHGLLSLVDPRAPGAGDERWGNGIIFDPVGCGGDVEIYDICDPASRGSESGTPDPQQVDPFAISAPITCSAMGADPRDLKAKAKRKLEAIQSWAVERELWTGTLLNTNQRLAHPDALSYGGGFSPSEGLAVMEQVLSDAGRGARGVIHMTVKSASLFAAQGLIEAKEEPGFRRPVLQTKLGTIVVPGSGYTGSAPDGSDVGTTDYMYGTGMVRVILGEPEVFPEDISMSFDRALNTFEIRAERPAIAYFDPCAHVAVGVTVPATPAGT